MTEPTADTVRAFFAHMCSEYGATVTPKASSAIMRAAGAGLGALRILDAERFASDFVTTLGATIYVPFTPGDDGGAVWTLWSQIEVLAHECQHIQQRRERGIRHEVDYVTSSAKRAHIEAEAYAVNAELHRWRYGVIESWWPGWRASALQHYGCSDADVAVATRHLQMVAVASRRGLVMAHAARTAIAWLDEHAPELRAPGVASRAPS